MAVKVLVADDSEVILKGIRALLLSDPDIQLVGECADYAETSRLVTALQPDVVVLDMRMPDAPSFDLNKLKCNSRIVAISFANDEEARRLAKLVGADSMLDKIFLGTELIPAIKRAAQ